jgi:hypothetical protein
MSLKNLKVQMLIEENDNYELFCDEWYYHLYCIRNKNDKRFNSPMSFHFVLLKDAKLFFELISKAK